MIRDVAGVLVCFAAATVSLYALAASLLREGSATHNTFLCGNAKQQSQKQSFYAWLNNISVLHSISRPSLSFPSNLDQLRSLASQLERLREEQYDRVLCVFAAAYLYKQTFAIPGSVFLVCVCVLRIVGIE